RLADDQVEHGVAEELHPLVAVEPVVGNRGVRQGFFQKLRGVEFVAEDLLGALTGFGIHGTTLISKRARPEGSAPAETNLRKRGVRQKQDGAERTGSLRPLLGYPS